MDIFKIIGLALIAAVVAITVRQQKPEIALQISIAAGVLIFIAVANDLTKVISVFNTISDKLGSDKEYITMVLKITGVAYVAEFASNVCKDCGESSIATKVEFAGKVVILLMCTPMIIKLFEVVSSLITG